MPLFLLLHITHKRTAIHIRKYIYWTRKNGHQEEEHVWLPPRNRAEVTLHVTPSSPAWLEGHILKQVPEGRPPSC